jgi:predicted N-acetyltransferase YhbS
LNTSSSNKPDWSMRKYRDGDEEQIRKLRGLVLSGAKDSQWWKWFYKDNPAGPALIWLAEADNEIIGHVAHVPIRMKIGDQEVTGAFGVDSMTHPDYQRRGILKKLQEKIAESSVEQGLCFSFGACLSHIMKIYKKLRITEICQQHLFVKITFWGKFFNKRFGIPCFLGNFIGCIWDFMAIRTSTKNSENIEINQIFKFEQNINEFWHKASLQKQIMVVRDMEYLNWRYFEKPGDPYKVFIAKREEDVVGYIVFQQGKIEPTAGLILDLFTLPDDNIVMEALIRKAINYFKEKGVLIIYCFMLPNTQYYPVLKRFGFIRRDSDLHFDIDIYNNNISKEFVTNPQNWYFVRGDTDVS